MPEPALCDGLLEAVRIGDLVGPRSPGPVPGLQDDRQPEVRSGLSCLLG